MKNTLNAFIHKALIIRFVFVAISLSLMFGVVVFFVAREKASKTAVEIAYDRLSAFANLYNMVENPREFFKSPEFMNYIEKFRSRREPSSFGFFAYTRVYDKRGVLLTEIFNSRYPENESIKDVLIAKDTYSLNFTNGKKDFECIDGESFLRIVFPLTDKNNSQIGYVSSFFKFTSSTTRSFIINSLKITLGVILVIFITSIILFPLIITLAHKVTHFSKELLDANIDSLKILGNAIAERDSDTDAHNYRVSIYSVYLAEKLILPEDKIRAIIKGSFLHDVGKIAIPDNILLKPGKLDSREFSIMKTHALTGYEIIKNSTWLEDAVDIVLYHHEKVSGDGYPEGLEGNAIPEIARIFAIADVFDALTSERPYKKPFTLEKTISIMTEGKDSHFDSVFFEKFIEISEYLYNKFAMNETDLREEHQSIITRYFYNESQILR